MAGFAYQLALFAYKFGFLIKPIYLISEKLNFDTECNLHKLFLGLKCQKMIIFHKIGQIVLRYVLKFQKIAIISFFGQSWTFV